MEIVKYPHPLLNKKTREIPKITKELTKLVPQMVKIMDEHEGIGLAGPQVGRQESMIIVKDGEDNLVFFNPKILSSSKQKGTEEEGCLSLPGLFVKVRRPLEVEVVAQDAKGQVLRITAKGLAARIFQHEIDHLQGKLIINRISPLAKLKVRKQLQSIAHEHRTPSAS
ncbi:MAG: peptide deformylase [bacterium]|nr:peptide deformylase [Candidatus Wildermuthbacteria bacterium]MDP2664564.1 peptide deformylase [bacterium]